MGIIMMVSVESKIGVTVVEGGVAVGVCGVCVCGVCVCVLVSSVESKVLVFTVAVWVGGQGGTKCPINCVFPHAVPSLQL